MAKTLAGWWKKNPLVVGALSAAVLLAAFLAFPAMHAQQSQPMVMLSDGTQVPDTDPSQDPPSQVARISAMDGNVSYEPASVNDFAAAEMNYPLTTGDRLYADASSDAEFQTTNLAVRLGALTDLTITALTDSLTQLGLAQGVVHLRSYQLDPGATVELDTQNVAITVLQPGDARVETDPNSDTTLITVLSGQVQVDGNGIQMTLQSGQSVQLRGSQPVAAQWMQLERQDAFDSFSAERDAQYVNAFSAQSNDVNPETIGADDLAQYGQWQNDADNGPVWYPTGVAVDWEPYRNGHWIWVAPWGYTWVEAERWGFAPFHYGRWARFGNRWGWVPGPPVVRPIWSPALVVFVGAPGVTAWFPLGPREPFVPWYHASTLYVNRVNVSNIYNRNTEQVRSGYNQRTTRLYPENFDNRNYANRRNATVAMNQDDFAAGRRVDRNSLRGQQSQLGNAPIVPHPTVTPQRTSVVSAPPRAVPPRINRPALASRNDTRVTAPPNPGSVAGPGGPRRTPPIHGPIVGTPAPITRTPLPPAPTAPVQEPNPIHGQPPVKGNPPSGRQPAPQPTAPVQEPNPIHGQPPDRTNPPRQPQPAPQPTAPVQEPNPIHGQPPVKGNPPPRQPVPNPAEPMPPVQQPNPTRGLPPDRANPPRQPQPAPQPTHTPPTSVQEPNPTRGQPPVQTVNPPRQPAPMPQPERPLFNKAVPPAPHPSFEQQQRAIQQTDPGRPLSPSQTENVRQNRPPGPPQQQEAQHPAPAPAPKPAPQTPPKPDDKKKQ